MSILITICARGGSKGIPGKNIKLLNEQPLIYYSLAIAEKFSQVQQDVDIVLSTDDQSIREVVMASRFNVDCDYIRPDYLASDIAGKLEVIEDVLLYSKNKRNKDYQFVIDLDVTSPLRTVEDLQNAFSILIRDKEAFNIFSVSPANRNPYFNIVEQKENGYYNTCKKGAFLSRQTAPAVYDMNASFYIYKKAFFLEGYKSALTDKSLIFEMNHICFDLDHLIDFEFMEFLVKNNKLEFDFQ